MASAAEQLAANVNWSAFSKAEELQRRIWFTLGALIVYRLGTYIPLPGIDPDQLAAIMRQQTQGLLGMFNMLSGGAVERMAIFALNVMPYISASIILQVMTTVSPRLEALKKEGEAGRKTINQYTRYLTVALSIVQSWAIARGLESQGTLVTNPGIVFEVTTVVTLTGGVMFLMWLGEQITSRGIGNGVSLIIFAGIVANLLSGFLGLMQMAETGAISWFSVVGLYGLVVVVITFIVFIERAQRRLLVQYPKRQIGNRMFGGDSSHLPLKLNTSGVIPPIFASSLLVLPLTVAQFNAANTPDWLAEVVRLMQNGTPLYMFFYGVLIAFFAFFYTAVVFNPVDTADNLKKYGGFIPGIRPGKKTAEYIDYVLTRLTVIGAAYLCLVCLIPEFILAQYGGNLLLLGGTSFLIIVSVTMDTVAQVHSHLLAHQYEGLIKKARFKSPPGHMIVVLFGPPASGKGTQAMRIHEKYAVAHLSTGDMLRAAIAAGTDIGKKAKAIMDKGQLVPDDVVLGIIADRIEQPDCKPGFVLDGFPRTLNQTEALDEMLKGKGRGVDVVVVMDVDEPPLVRRVENRALEARRKGEPVRPDDDPETFVRRLGVYKAETAPILPYYEAQGKIRRVDALKSIGEVAAQIDAILAGKSPESPGFPNG